MLNVLNIEPIKIQLNQINMNQFTQLQTFKKSFKMTVKTLFFLIALIAGLSRAQAQLTVTVTNSGNTTPNLASSYSSLASAIADLNAVTAFSGPVTLTCSGTSETAPTGGFVITYTAAPLLVTMW